MEVCLVLFEIYPYSHERKESCHHMKKRRIFAMLAGVCLLLCGCGTENENTDAVLQNQQEEDTAAPSAQEDDIAESESEEGGKQTEEESESKSGDEQTDEASENGKEVSEEEAVKREALLAAGAQEGDILLWDYDDYDGDGAYEAFMIVGNIFEGQYETEYKNEALWFTGADGNTLQLRDSYNHGYRMIDGKMDFGQRKYLYFYSDRVATANISEIWTVRDGKPVEESDLFQMGQVIYRGENERNEFEIWVDAYDWEHDIDVELDIDIWIGHTWKPYFYHYNSDRDRIEAYEGKLISEEDFKELSGTDIIEEIKAEGCTVGDIIRWDNDIVTINYERHNVFNSEESVYTESAYYENVIWDNNEKDFWQKKAQGVTSWKNAGVGGSYRCGSMRR